MSSDFPLRPRLQKGALVSFPSHFLGPVPNVIVFQYNPEQLSRNLTDRIPRQSSDQKGSAREEAYVVTGPPVETINITVDLDAADQLSEPAFHPHTVQFGIHPALAALEMLLYPSQAQRVKIELLSGQGGAQITSSKLPLTLFVWGKSRVVPVRVTSFSVTEQAFDQQLNPLRAKVTLGMKVLTNDDLKQTSLGRDVYIAYQSQKEALARLNLASSVEQITSMLPF
ncbi:MAG: hypothetical protein NTY37_13000 [Methanothrix sp.]|nr:hypothetical protein [Methanothrix sp.]